MAADAAVDELVDGVRAGDRAAVARALTVVESRRSEDREIASELLERLGCGFASVLRVGISGLPGSGKSTLIERLGRLAIDRRGRVAVLAVDPTSAISGGSILGDKTRMGALAQRPEAFIRPSPTGGSLGGVSRRTREAMFVLEAAGHEVVIVETVGVGQSEAAVAGMVDVFVVLLIAGAGDELQGIKRGILEVADVVAVNKADVESDAEGRERAERMRDELSSALALLRGGRDSSPPPVLAVSARTGRGVAELWEEIERHHEKARESSALERRRRKQRVRWMEELVEERLVEGYEAAPAVRRLRERLGGEVENGEKSPAAAAKELLGRYFSLMSGKTAGPDAGQCGEAS